MASFPVEASDQIMLVTDGGQIIRMPIDDIRVISRGTQGVKLFDTEGAHVVSVERLTEGDDPDEAQPDTGAESGGAK